MPVRTQVSDKFETGGQEDMFRGDESNDLFGISFEESFLEVNRQRGTDGNIWLQFRRKL